MLETSQLQTLVAVAKFSSFSKAAEELGVTQSAISQSIKNLENKMGAELFNRNGKNITLTFEGKKLYYFALDILSKFDSILVDIQENKNAMKGKIKIGTLYGIGKSWLSPEIIEFSKNYPELSIEVSLGLPSELIMDFENHKLDALVIPDFAIPSNSRKTLIGLEKSVLVIPKQSDFTVNKDIKLDEFAKLPTILYEKDDSLYKKWVRDYFGQVPKFINKRLVFNSHSNILKAVGMGLGIAVIPTHVLGRSKHKDGVQTFGKDAQVLNSKIYFVTHKENYNLLKIKKLKETLQNSNNPLSA